MVMKAPGFWDNPEISNQKMKELKNLQDSVKAMHDLETQYEDIETLIEMGNEANDEEMAEEIREELNSFIETFEEIRIGTFSSISQHWLPSLIKRFNQKYPNILFRLYQGDYTTMGDWLHPGYIDFCFADLAAIPGFNTITLAKDSFLAVLPVDHPLAKHPMVPLSSLTSEPLIAAEEGNVSTVLAAFESIGQKPHIQYAVHDDYTILAMVEQGLGYSILPAMVLDRTNYAFRAVPTTPAIIRQIGVAYREIEMMPMATQHFMKFMNDSLDELVRGHYTPIK